MKTFSNWILVTLLLTCQNKAFAALHNPNSQHSQFTSYGMFFDPQTMIVFRSGGRAWAAIGGSYALAEWPDADWKPQLVLQGSANVAYEYSNNAGGTLYTQTVDARLGLAYDVNFAPDLRAALIWTHQSGHIADNVPNKELIGSDLGNEVLDLRVIRDIDYRWRVGGGLRPYVLTNPHVISFGAEQFAEWYPKGSSESTHDLVPFLAAGFEEYGVKSVELTAHLEMGLVAADHLRFRDHQAVRYVIGAYSGWDPRLKYYQFKSHKDHFVYSGVVFEM